MKNSLFRKYMTLSLSIILIGFTVLGVLLVVFTGNIWAKEKRELLSKNAQNVSVLCSNTIDLYGSFDTNRDALVPRVINIIAESSDSDIFLTDDGGFAQFCSDLDSCMHYSHAVPDDILEAALDGGFNGISDLDGMYEQPHYIVAVPIQSNGRTIGAVFAATPAKGLYSYAEDILRIFIICAVLVIIFTFVAVYIVTYRLVRPLHIMAKAARMMAQGDFTTKVPLPSHGSDEIGDLAEAFNNMSDSLKRMEQMRRSFIANVSHELKTPMTTISGFIDGILDGTIPQNKRDEYMRIVSDEVRRLSKMVSAMLGLSKLEAGELRLTVSDFDIVSLLCRTVVPFEHTIEEKQIDILGLDSLAPETVSADLDLITQVIYNLVENAVKFTPRGGTIEFFLYSETDRVVVSIRNSGEGIPETELPHIFERFYKTDKSRGIDKNGMGLGLYLVKTIVSIHGGRVVATSIPGEFSEFSFIIPRKFQ